jgi:hypothetical protein
MSSLARGATTTPPSTILLLARQQQRPARPACAGQPSLVR